MSLVENVNADIKAAMLAREKDKLEALRAVKSALLLAQSEKGGTGEVSEDAEIKMLQKLVKQRRETAEIYINQNRKELADVELFQADIIQQYLPKQMDISEIKQIIKDIITEVGATSIKDMGKVMGIASKKLAGLAEGKDISDKVKALLS